MASPLLQAPDAGYSLSEAGVVSQPWPAATTSPDSLARDAVVTSTDQAPDQSRKILIRKRGPARPAEIRVNGHWPAAFLKSAGAVIDLLNLPAGWNSYGAKPIAPQNAAEAIRLLAVLIGAQTPPPNVVPRVRGGIQLEWHAGNIDIEIYIDSPDKVSVFAEQVETGETLEGALADHQTVLNAWLQTCSRKASPAD